MKILLYSLNYAPELTGIGKYSGELATWLAQQGHQVKVVTAPPYYPHWQVEQGYSMWHYRRESIDQVDVWRCPLYVPAQPRTLSRLLHLLSFAMSSLPVVLGHWYWRPQVVMVVEPTFFCVPAALLLGKLSHAITLLHVQDFELDAMLGLGMAKRGWLSQFCRAVESFFMRQFNLISSISQSMLVKVRQKAGANTQTFYFPNWVDTDHIHPEACSNALRQKMNIPTETFIVLYAGNLGTKQGLEILLETAQAFSDTQDVLFLLLGEGAAKPALQKQAKQLRLQNVRFAPLLPYEDLPALMRLVDIHVVVQKKGVSDAVMPSKLTTLLAAGAHILITAEEHTELGQLCVEHPGIARRVEPEQSAQFIQALREMLAEERIGKAYVNHVGRKYAVRFLSKHQVLPRFVDMLEQTLASQK